MVGDWVRQTGSGILLQVEEIHPPYIYAVGKGGQFMDIEPIPLTPEILEKNGISSSDTGCFFDEDKNALLEISCINGEVFWTININEYDIIRLRYIHELQHALRLCGIEKEIEL